MSLTELFSIGLLVNLLLQFRVRHCNFALNFGLLGLVSVCRNYRVCIIGTVAVAADDVTGVGVVDDFLLGPLGTGVGEGLIMIFG